MRDCIMTGLIFTALALSVAAAHPATAQSNDPLKDICTGFLAQNNLTAGASPDILCSCLVREIQGQLSRSEMEAYQRAVDAGTAMSAALNAKITGIAVTCLTEGR